MRKIDWPQWVATIFRWLREFFVDRKRFFVDISLSGNDISLCSNEISLSGNEISHGSRRNFATTETIDIPKYCAIFRFKQNLVNYRRYMAIFAILPDYRLHYFFTILYVLIFMWHKGFILILQCNTCTVISLRWQWIHYEYEMCCSRKIKISIHVPPPRKGFWFNHPYHSWNSSLASYFPLQIYALETPPPSKFPICHLPWGEYRYFLNPFL